MGVLLRNLAELRSGDRRAACPQVAGLHVGYTAPEPGAAPMLLHFMGSMPEAWSYHAGSLGPCRVNEGHHVYRNLSILGAMAYITVA